MNLPFVIWNNEDKPCRKRGCKKPMKAVLLLVVHVSKGCGPQGGWSCDGGHKGWIWPEECV